MGRKESNKKENKQKLICNFLFFLTATLVMTLSNLEGEETFEPSLLGHADEVVQERICDDELILIKG